MEEENEELYEESIEVEESQPEEEPIEEPQPQPPKKRKVIGRIPKQHVKLQYGRTYSHSDEEYAPQPQYIPQYPQQQMPQKPPTRRDLERQAAQQVEYEMMVEQQRNMAMRAQQPRQSTARKLLNVANQYAGTSGKPLNICERTSQVLAVRSNVQPLYKAPAKQNTSRLNAVIKNVAPKFNSPVKISTKSNKKRGFAF